MRRTTPRFLNYPRTVPLIVTVFLLLASWPLGAQDNAAGENSPPPDEPRPTFLEHSPNSKWWISGQANIVFQAHGDFYAKYSGPNSLKATAENATSRVLTLFTG